MLVQATNGETSEGGHVWPLVVYTFFSALLSHFPKLLAKPGAKLSGETMSLPTNLL